MTTIARTKTVKVLTDHRGKEVEIVEPRVGSLVAEVDNGYFNLIGYARTFVVVEVIRSKATGRVAKARICPLVELTEETVTYDDSDKKLIRLAFKKGYASWKSTKCPLLLFYRWDSYVEHVSGDANK